MWVRFFIDVSDHNPVFEFNVSFNTMSLPLYVALILCCGSICFGHWLAKLWPRASRIEKEDWSSPAVVDTRKPTPSVEAIQMQAWLQSLWDVTNQVTSQVDQHNLKLNEATRIFETPTPSTGSAAASILIAANQQLQNQLAAAKIEIDLQRKKIDSVVVESRTDPLTKLANRRAFDLELDRVFNLFRRKRASFSLMLIDIDHFKQFNDNHGHMIGDRILQDAARGFGEIFRDTEFVARFGGEEFVVLLPMTTLKQAVMAAERVRKKISENVFHVGEFGLRITISIGVAEVIEGENPADLIRRADQALYAAKDGGRNLTAVSADDVCVDATEFGATNSDVDTTPSDSAGKRH